MPCSYGFIPIPPLNHRYMSRCPSSSTLRLSVSPFLACFMPATVVLYPTPSHMNSISSGSPPLSFHTVLSSLSQLIPVCPFVVFSRTVLSTIAGSIFFCMFFLVYCSLNLLVPPFISSECTPNSAPIAVLLVVFEHPPALGGYGVGRLRMPRTDWLRFVRTRGH